MAMLSRRRGGTTDTAAPAAGGRAPRRGQAVDVALVLAVDVSGSMTDSRIQLQLQGYAGALRHPEFLAAVRGGRRGQIALTFVEWSEAGRQIQAVDWRLIRNAADRDAFVASMLAAERPTPGWTSISSAIAFAAELLVHSGVDTERRVIDISGDGTNNDGPPVTAARDAAVAAGITINGLPIVEADPGLDAYYRSNVIGGRDSFLVVARDMEAFAAAILRKLLVEVAGDRPGAEPRLARDTGAN